MSKNNSIHAYRKTETNTAGPEKLLLMLYEGAIRFIKMAIESSDKQAHEDKLKYIDKTRKIVSEFRSTLNHQVDSEFSANLDRLYEYANKLLLEATLEREKEKLEQALEIFVSLHSSWKSAIEGLKAKP